MTSSRGYQALRRSHLERSRLSHSFLRFTSFLLLLLWSTNCSAFHQKHPLHRPLSPKLQLNSWKVPTSSQSYSSLKHFLGNQKQTSTVIRVATKSSSSSSCTSSNNNDNRRFRRGLVRRIILAMMLLLSAASIFPRLAVASTVAAPTAPVVPPPILTSPVSASTEYRLMGRLVVAALIGAALGKERSFAKHSAGVRTMSLVSMGAAVFTVCSGYGFLNFPRVDGT